ncbi:MAG: glycosyltransferase family 39 protein [Tannerella sp.]|jgi:hypothetical protein|nr:glycosyltransferase family 39 protein [Tannerella sp.]
MIFVGLFLSFILGFSVISAVSHRFSLPEKLGMSFIIGVGIQTLLMAILDLLSIPLTITSIFIFSFIILLAALFFCHKTKNELINEFKSFSFRHINCKQYMVILWLIVLIAVGYIEFLNWEKCVYFPTFDRDSIVGFDFMGRVIAHEHKMGLSGYFTGEYSFLGNKGASYTHYTPFVHLSYAYVYLLGAETSKMINALFFLSFIITFYAALRNKITPTLAISATLFTLLVPEFTAFSSMSATNVLHATYASLAVIYAWLFFNTNQKRYFGLMIILSALNIWTRQEGIVFIAAIACMLLIKAVKNKPFKKLLVIYSVLTVLPFIYWLVYLKIFNLGSQSESMNLMPFWDANKFNTIREMTWWLLSNTTYYSLTFIVFGLAILASLFFMIKKRTNYELPGMFLISLLCFCILVYQIEYNWDSLENVMNYSCKRFLFCFVPIAWAFTFTNPLMEKVNDWFNKMLQ